MVVLAAEQEQGGGRVPLGCVLSWCLAERGVRAAGSSAPLPAVPQRSWGKNAQSLSREKPRFPNSILS